MERAKHLFLKYNGNHFHMDREGDGNEYDNYHISRETEEMWTREFISSFLGGEMRGREAYRVYAAVTELQRRDARNDDWDKCLYYPLRAKGLDDVSILYMLNCSFRMAEQAVKKKCFSREEAAAYIRELDNYIRQVKVRAESETLTRADGYEKVEFSDPVYVAGYLSALREKWNGLFR